MLLRTFTFSFVSSLNPIAEELIFDVRECYCSKKKIYMINAYSNVLLMGLLVETDGLCGIDPAMNNLCSQN